MAAADPTGPVRERRTRQHVLLGLVVLCSARSRLVCRHEPQRLSPAALHPQRDLRHRRRGTGSDLRLHGRLLAGSDRLPGHRRLRSALLSMPPMVKQPMLLPGLPDWLATFDMTGWHPQVALLFACIISGLVAALVGALVGAPLMRLSGHYVAVATMGFLIIVHSIAVNWDEVTRGARGLSQIPTSTTPGWPISGRQSPSTSRCACATPHMAAR